MSTQDLTSTLTKGPWEQTIRSTGVRGSILTSSMVSQSPTYNSHYRTAGKTLGCVSPGNIFDYTGKYSLTGDGCLQTVRPVVSGEQAAAAV